jgi:hypothetical protein
MFTANLMLGRWVEIDNAQPTRESRVTRTCEHARADCDMVKYKAGMLLVN